MIKCIIVDDEPPALDLIERYVKQTPFLEQVGKYTNAFEAIEIINREAAVDLLFLDIQMSNLNGLELSRVLKKGPKIIFTTAYEKYALEGFKVDAIDYLLKPFNYEEFLKAASKAREWIDLMHNAQTFPEYEREFIFIKSDYKQIRVALNDILYVEGFKDYVKIYIEGKQWPIISLMSLKILEDQLQQNFMRIHRSYIVNLNKIDAIERGQVIINKLLITISENYKDQFQNYIASKSIIS